LDANGEGFKKLTLVDQEQIQRSILAGCDGESVPIVTTVFTPIEFE
jgi:hypothetical protein